MEVQTVRLIACGDTLDLALMATVGEHVDNLESILFVRSGRIRQDNIHAVCGEVRFVYIYPLRTIVVFQRDIVERHAILATGEARFQLGPNLLRRIQLFLACKCHRYGQATNNDLMGNNRLLNLILDIGDGNSVTPIIILFGADRVTLLRVKARSSSLICNAVVTIDDQRADCHIMIFTIRLNRKGQITVLTNLVCRCIGIGFCGDALNVLNNITSSSRRNCNVSILHELSLNHNISAQVFNGQRIGQRVSLLHGYPKCTHVVLGNLNIIYSPFCNHVIRTTSSRNSLKL